MTTFDNAAPLAEWVCEPRPCPLLHLAEDLRVPANICLGSE